MPPRSIECKLWLGNFASEDAAMEFCEVNYDDRDEISCPLWREVGIGWFDHDQQEVVYDHWRDYLRSISVELDPELLRQPANTAVLVYDEHREIDSPRSGTVLRYAGTIRVRL